MPDENAAANTTTAQEQNAAAGAAPAAQQPKAEQKTEKIDKDDKKKNLGETVNHLTETVKALNLRTKIIGVLAIIAILAISIALTVYLNRVQYTALFSGLDADEAGQIMTLLSDEGVDAHMQGTDTIMVPEDQADELRVSMAAQGYPESGLNYDLFTDSSQFGSTDIETQTRLQYTLQENIRRTINNMDKIEDSIVIVNLASSSSYVVSKNKNEASAAVMLELESGAEIDDAAALSIAEFVMRSVPNLTLENISIVDSKMHSYDLTESNSVSSTYSDTQMQLAEQMKSILSKQALNVLEPALGSGNVTVSVNLALDFDKETQSSVEFSAPIEGETEGMLRSLEETLNSAGDGSSAGEPVGTDSNGVSNTEYMTTDGSGEYSNSSTRIYNYELNELQTQIEKAQGSITNLSISILLNSDAEGASAAQAEVENLVANAIGVDPQYISVAALPFVQSADVGFADYLAENQALANRATLLSIGRIVLICLTILLVVILILRFLRKRKEAEQAEALAAQQPALSQTGVGDAANLDDEQIISNEEMLADLVQKKSGETEKVEKLVEDYPEAAVQILRNWLTDD